MSTSAKRYFYIASFVFLGFLVQLLIHAAVEILYIGLLTTDFETYGLGFSWDAWYGIHHAGAVVLAVLGIAVGLQQGRYWWKKLYES